MASFGARPPHRDGTNVLEYLGVTLFPVVPCRSPFITPSPTRDVCFSQNFIVTTARRVLFPRTLLVQSFRLPHIRWPLIFVLSLFIIHFPSLLASDLSHLVFSHLLTSQVVCAMTFSAFLVIFVSWMFPYVVPSCSLAS